MPYSSAHGPPLAVGRSRIAASNLPDLSRRAGAENFSVAPWFLPRAQRQDLMTLYGFARTIDWIGDEFVGDRLTLLEWAEAELGRASAGTATHPVFVRLSGVIQRCSLPHQPFRDLIEANRRDQRQQRYATFDDLLDYCRLSANPVGRLVLGVLGAASPERLVWSDDVCTALQVVEHLQDVGEDAVAGRIYLPAEDMDHFGCVEADLFEPRASPQVCALVRFEATRARTMLSSGVPLAASLRGRPRLLVAGFVGGGDAVIDAIESLRGDVLANRCRPSKRRTVTRMFRLLSATRHRAGTNR